MGRTLLIQNSHRERRFTNIDRCVKLCGNHGRDRFASAPLSYSVRHQIFVSSTFTDLVEERAEVIQALWELDCIPTGMEAFVASNDSQWDVIKRVIDECDYYVLIIGGRYGSITNDGISYTEKEYRYAKKIGLPVLAFVHADPEAIASGKTEKDDSLRQKLETFREDVMKDHPVRTWSSPTELGGIVSRSLVREIKINPRPGWIRNDGSSPIKLLEQVQSLTLENKQLRDSQEATNLEKQDVMLEHGEDTIDIYGVRDIKELEDYSFSTAQWKVNVSWDEMFRDIGPGLINESTESDMQAQLARFHIYDSLPAHSSYRYPRLSPESWAEILIQFRALGLIQQGIKKRGVNDRNSYWAITKRGDTHLVSLLARRRVDPVEELLG